MIRASPSAGDARADTSGGGHRISLGAEFARKGIHLGSCVAPFLFAFRVQRTTGIVILAALAVTSVAIEWARRNVPAVRSAVQAVFGPMLRSQEHTGGWTGATWMLIAFALVAAIYPRNVAAASMLAVSWGDGTAAIVGRVFGRHPFPGSQKTWEGSAACLGATFLGAWLVAGLGVTAGAVGAVAATAAEQRDGPLDDNLRVALATGAGILLWRMMFS